jgi:alpha-1,3-rhamnosyl/mannosyltransferase
MNLLYLKPGKVGGSEEYCRRIIDALDTEAPNDVELTLFVNGRFGEAFPGLVATHATVVAPISGDVPPVRIVAESSWLAVLARRRPIDLLHHVANTIPQVRTRPSVVTLHDLQPVVRPQDFDRSKGAYLRARIASSARHAGIVITPSGYVRDLVIERFGRDPAHVVVVPAPLRPSARDTPRSGGSSIVDAIGRPFFVYPAITHAHKNHATLLRAFARLAATRTDASLVLTGGAGTHEDTVLRDIAQLGLTGRVHRLGRISRPDLDALLARATALTFPSAHEGYGLPAAEAMALGCPVIASDATALPEVVGDAGILVSPRDTDAWTAAMEHVLDDERARESMIEAGRARVRELTPANAARRSVDAYRLALR